MRRDPYFKRVDKVKHFSFQNSFEIPSQKMHKNSKKYLFAEAI